jgi:hypothetical protein
MRPAFVEPVVLLNRNELNHLRRVEINKVMGLHLADLAAETQTQNSTRSLLAASPFQQSIRGT